MNDNPLIYYSIRVAQQFQKTFGDIDIALSTDSSEIKKIAEDYGLFTNYIRPEFLSGDTVGKVDALKDILMWQENHIKTRYDYILDLDITSPLRNLADLTTAFSIINSNEAAVNLFSVSQANRSPYFNMVEQKSNGFYAQVKQHDNQILTRQSAPKVYDLNASFYFYKRHFFELGYSGAITERSLIYEVPHICFDLDHPTDFEFISFLMKNDKLDFEL